MASQSWERRGQGVEKVAAKVEKKEEGVAKVAAKVAKKQEGKAAHHPHGAEEVTHEPHAEGQVVPEEAARGAGEVVADEVVADEVTLAHARHVVCIIIQTCSRIPLHQDKTSSAK